MFIPRIVEASNNESLAVPLRKSHTGCRVTGVNDHLNQPHGGELVDLLADRSASAEIKRESREWLSWEIDYLTRVRGFIRKQLAQGSDPEVVTDLAGYREFAGDRISMDRHGMLNRHRGTVNRIVNEELST